MGLVVVVAESFRGKKSNFFAKEKEEEVLLFHRPKTKDQQAVCFAWPSIHQGSEEWRSGECCLHFLRCMRLHLPGTPDITCALDAGG